ncbi:YciI family protein [Jidongwangia harbinensis]|uniref:YciI family protein n=1 Tax=Jidongwangia harbinensis TaxID=2878561 RepID=UPI001CD955BE|nr:YciI family protein [Jidongwangia harbinensis]MCA2212896.1 YciI family protein [Jidongwangia harbinensis]
MKYLILIHSNQQSLELWDTLTDEQRLELGRGHMRLTEELAESGELIVSEGLADPALARWVSVRDGETIASDGPFAEVKEHLAGFYLIDCDSLERAVEWAAKVPDAAYREVEVRPILDMSGWEF